ncbi:hypothetical protein, partial [Burkholderia cenocepacia]|uniref:hypothetical protein n=1 Tax=Burkholderia cenocepacia TaxID=95486 RepID=UPI001C4DFDF1
MFRIDGAGVDVLAITVNAHNNQKTDQAVYLYAMANVRSNAHQRWFKETLINSAWRSSLTR